MLGSERGSGKYLTGDDAPGRGSAHRQAPLFSVSFAEAGDLEDEPPSPSPLPPAPFGTPVSALLMGPREVLTTLSMLLLVAADVGLPHFPVGLGERGSGPYLTGNDAPGRGSAHRQAPPFSVSFAEAGDLEDEPPSPSPLPPAPFGTPVSALLMGPREVLTTLSMLLLVAADVGLPHFSGRLGWSFPSSVAGVVGLFAGVEFWDATRGGVERRK
ncbi:unnamed protein product [Ectocarpus sp. CCAP 1310/34]|nr:unnamed protein product [Ectocarpus sp. CCAP 1310/34]